VLVVGVSEGRTTLLVWKTSGTRLSYSVTVRKKDPNEIVDEVRRLLGEGESITARLAGDRIYHFHESFSGRNCSVYISACRRKRTSG
jgi:pilus assembly protein CpaC